MLAGLLKSLLRRQGATGRRDPTTHTASAADVQGAPPQLPDDPLLKRHLEVLFKSVTVGTRSFLELYFAALRESGTGVPRPKWYRRAQRAFHLARYFEHSLEVEGGRAECGVFSGFSALLLCKVEEALGRGAMGDFFLLDSFEGLSEIKRDDLLQQGEGAIGASRYSRGDMRVPFERVQAVFGDYRHVRILKGWIPQVFAGLPERPWSFVHVDVDLYEPTLASLEYFFPRLSKGGVIVNDDYATADFPGAGRAWDRFCTQRQVPFLVLDTGQAVLMR